jgi:putative PIN family toxin of toxin-antitoxin system
VRVILDTNVLISGIFFSGPPGEILKAWRDGKVQFTLTPEIVDEYVRVARTIADQFPGVEINQILALIIANSNIIQPPPFPHQVCEDTDDDKFLACALASETNTIVSGDKHLLKLSGYRGITVSTPRAFVNQYLKK